MALLAAAAGLRGLYAAPANFISILYAGIPFSNACRARARRRNRGNPMCDNPLCDICCASQRRTTSSSTGKSALDGARRSRWRDLAWELAAGVGVVGFFTIVMSGATALRLWHIVQN
jgi:hypothetical protein